jgi:hypothetical protein
VALSFSLASTTFLYCLKFTLSQTSRKTITCKLSKLFLKKLDLYITENQGVNARPKNYFQAQMQNPIFIKLSQFYANVHYNKLIEHKDMCKKTCEDQDNELTLEI